jgi:predicted ATP-binding protein involved in virulence
MKIKRLIAEAVFGYLNFDLKFNHDITFLTGINGDGKTTALRLILALLTPSLRELDKIPHHSVELLMQTDVQLFIIKSKFCNNKMVLSVNTESEQLEYYRLNLSQFEDSPRAENRIEEHYSIIEEKFSDPVG